MSAKCRRCQKRKPAENSLLCLSCLNETGGKDEPEETAGLKCGCGRDTLTGLEVCEICWRQQDREVPDAPVYTGLKANDPTGRRLCPCGGTVQVINTFDTGSWFECRRCGHKFDEPPIVLASYDVHPDELQQMLQEDDAEERREKMRAVRKEQEHERERGLTADDWSE